MDTLVQDIRFGLRMLLKNRAVTAVALAMLALGIGANTAVFSAMNSLMLRPLSFLVGVGPGDPLIFTLVAVLLLAVGLLASCIPARRAMKVDPLIALKNE